MPALQRSLWARRHRAVLVLGRTRSHNTKSSRILVNSVASNSAATANVGVALRPYTALRSQTETPRERERQREIQADRHAAGISQTAWRLQVIALSAVLRKSTEIAQKWIYKVEMTRVSQSTQHRNTFIVSTLRRSAVFNTYSYLYHQRNLIKSKSNQHLLSRSKIQVVCTNTEIQTKLTWGLTDILTNLLDSKRI